MINSQSVNSDLTIQSFHQFHQLRKLKELKNMTLFLLLIMLYGLDGGESCSEREKTASQCTVVDCLPDEISELLGEKENQMNSSKDLRKILNIKKMCRDVIFNETVLDFYIRVEKKAINSVINMTVPERIKSYYHEDLSMTVVKMNFSKTDDYLHISAPGVLDTEEVAETWIPLKPFQNLSDNKIGVVTYDSDQQFKLKLGEKSVASRIIRIEVPGHDIKGLDNPLKIWFKMNHTNVPSNNLSCQFYDEKGNKSWKKDGCHTSNITDNFVECSCDHMTPFAVLLTKLEISQQHWEILSIISYVGCGLSAIFSALSILSFMFSSYARAEVSSSIHVSLSGALLLLDISFMLSEWAGSLKNIEVCVFIAVMIHYSLLSCFTWMAVEALHLYILLIRVFNIYIRHYMIKLSLVGWGVPAVVVGCLLSVQNTLPFYGPMSMTLSDNNTTNTICWIKDDTVLYGVNLSYFTIVFLFNLGILITVSRQIFKLRHVGSRQGKMPLWKDVSTVLGLMCLLGTTWGLIFFTSGYTNYPILYLFCILNTMQVSTGPPWYCYQVPEKCMKERDVARCIEEKMRTCTQPKGRLINRPDYFFRKLSPSESTVDIKNEYMINISSEALQRSRNKKNNDTEVDLNVSLLNETIFRVSSSSDTEKGNDQHESEPILHGQTVLGVWLGVKEVHNLSQPIQLVFRNNSQNERGICVYWHLDEKGRGNWSTDGCNTSNDNGDIVCSCNHLSFFAVLISPQIPEASHIVHLNYISYVGSGLSIAFTALMIVMFLCQRKKQCEHSIFIHVQLSASLFLLHISFLCSVWFSGQKDIDSACRALGLLLHWCLLSTFTWTAIEGFNLYLLLVRVFNIYIKRYLLKLSLVGWGVPTFTVMICGVTESYGKYSFYTDNENSTATPLCWVRTQTVSYITVNGYLGLVLLFNTAMLAVVLVKMRQLRAQALQIKDHQRRAWKDWVSLLGLCCVLGVPWGLAFSTYGPLSLPSLYVFTILNSFQGIFIFLWFLTLTCQTRKEKQISSKGTIQVSFQSNEEYVTTR